MDTTLTRPSEPTGPESPGIRRNYTVSGQSKDVVCSVFRPRLLNLVMRWREELRARRGSNSSLGLKNWPICGVKGWNRVWGRVRINKWRERSDRPWPLQTVNSDELLLGTSLNWFRSSTTTKHIYFVESPLQTAEMNKAQFLSPS